MFNRSGFLRVQGHRPQQDGPAQTSVADLRLPAERLRESRRVCACSPHVAPYSSSSNPTHRYCNNIFLAASTPITTPPPPPPPPQAHPHTPPPPTHHPLHP